MGGNWSLESKNLPRKTALKDSAKRGQEAITGDALNREACRTALHDTLSLPFSRSCE